MIFTRSRVRPSVDASWTLAQRDAGLPTRDAHAPRDARDPWERYWETLPFRAQLCRFEAEDFVARLATAVALRRDWRLLDFGCGFGMITALLAPSVREVRAWDPSPS